MSGDREAVDHAGDAPVREADSVAARRPSHAPIFGIDPGWPFVIAGLALIVSAVLIPAQRELHDLEQQLKVHQAYEEKAKSELLAYEQFLADVQRGEPRLLERLVRAQLNKMPKDERPLLLMPTANDTVPQWIESSVTVEIPEPVAYPDTLLSRIASGPRRLWVLASGTFLVFMGILFVPSTGARRPARRAAAVHESNSPAPAFVGSGVVAGEVAGVGAAAVEEMAVEDVAVEDVAVEDVAVEDVAVEDVAAASPAEVVVEPETLDSALFAGETFEATDLHELQYGKAADEAVALGGEAAEMTIEGSIEVADAVSDAAGADELAEQPVVGVGPRAEDAVAACAIETFPTPVAPPAPTDRALDSLSLFSGIEDGRWIDTREARA